MLGDGNSRHLSKWWIPCIELKERLVEVAVRWCCMIWTVEMG